MSKMFKYRWEIKYEINAKYIYNQIIKLKNDDDIFFFMKKYSNDIKLYKLFKSKKDLHKNFSYKDFNELLDYIDNSSRTCLRDLLFYVNNSNFQFEDMEFKSLCALTITLNFMFIKYEKTLWNVHNIIFLVSSFVLYLLLNEKLHLPLELKFSIQLPEHTQKLENTHNENIKILLNINTNEHKPTEWFLKCNFTSINKNVKMGIKSKFITMNITNVNQYYKKVNGQWLYKDKPLEIFTKNNRKYTCVNDNKRRVPLYNVIYSLEYGFDLKLYDKKILNHDIHHVDGNPNNNEIWNLELLSRKEHKKIEENLLSKTKLIIYSSKLDGELLISTQKIFNKNKLNKEYKEIIKLNDSMSKTIIFYLYSASKNAKFMNKNNFRLYLNLSSDLKLIVTNNLYNIRTHLFNTH